MGKIKFYKMCASGNDFIIIDNRKGCISHIAYHISDFVREICQRKKPVGADGVLLIENSSRADLKMRVFNPDGREVEMCGNGARCIALYINSKCPPKAISRSYGADKMQNQKCKIETEAGILEAEVVAGDRVRLKMPDPKDFRFNFNLEVDRDIHKANFINTGVPHVVRFVRSLDSIDVEGLGKAIRYHEEFQPEGTNVDFVEVIGDKDIKVRTYERGVEGETLACGTGAAASAVVAHLLGFIQPPTMVHTKGGSILTVYLNPSDSPISSGQTKVTNLLLEGAANFVYEGEIDMDKEEK